MINLSFNFNLFNNQYYFYERFLVILFSLVPSLILVGFVLYSDRKSKEPTKNIVICLLSGILTVSLASYLEGLIMPYFSNSASLTYAWAMIEEISKTAIFFLFIYDNKHFDDIYDGIVYMMLIALSFAGIENIMYAFSESTIVKSISLAMMRDLTTIPLHTICGIIIGMFISLGYFSKLKFKKYINYTLAILSSGIIHGTFNNLMNILSEVSINYNSSLQILFFQALPLVLIMVFILGLAVYAIRKTIILNNVFMADGEYEYKYSYLMTKKEFAQSERKLRRDKIYNKTNFINEEAGD